MEVDVEESSPTTSPVKHNGEGKGGFPEPMGGGTVVEVSGPVVIHYKDKKNREKVKFTVNLLFL